MTKNIQALLGAIALLAFVIVFVSLTANDECKSHEGCNSFLFVGATSFVLAGLVSAGIAIGVWFEEITKP